MVQIKWVFTAALLGCMNLGAANNMTRQDGGEVVAEVAGHKISLSDLEQKKAARLLQARNELFIAERDALNQYIDEQVLEEKAKAEHLTVEQLLKRDVASHVTDPTEDQLKVYYEGVDTKDPYDSVRDKIMAHIHDQRVSRARAEYVKNLRDQYAVRIMLSPPSAHVSLEGAAIQGPPSAAVTVVEFADYECPYCQQIHPEIKKLVQQYDGKITFAFKDCPLPMHRQAGKAAEAARCAGDQNKFWEYHDLLFEKAGSRLDVPQLKEYARSLQLDSQAFDRCLDTGEKTAAVQKGFHDAKDLGISGTPSFFVNGHFVSGALKYDDLREMVDKELAASTQVKKD